MRTLTTITLLAVSVVECGLGVWLEATGHPDQALNCIALAIYFLIAAKPL